jgi:hypothetical protein
MHCTGGKAPQRRPDFGRAWASLEDAMNYVLDPAPHGDPSRPMPGLNRKNRKRR